jgi:hypothetical protein
MLVLRAAINNVRGGRDAGLRLRPIDGHGRHYAEFWLGSAPMKRWAPGPLRRQRWN